MQARRPGRDSAESGTTLAVSPRSLGETRSLPTRPPTGSGADAYGERLEAAIACLARATGAPADRELARLREVRALLGASSEVSAVLAALATGAAADRAPGPIPAVVAGVLAAVPAVYELVAVYRGGTLAGFGYMTYGPVRSSLARATGEVLHGALTLLARSGALDDARLLARAFRLAHPRASALDARSALTGVLLVGMVTGAGGRLVKAYLRAPLGERDERDAIEAIQARVGLDGLAAHDALLRAGGSFQGLGLDLGGGAAGRRLKVYARVSRADLAGALARLRTTVGGDPLALERLVESLDGPWLSPVVELALAVRPGAGPTLKATAFLEEARATGPAVQAVSRLLASRGNGGNELRNLLAATTGSRDLDAWARAIHGAGAELGPGEPKMSVYVRPMI